MMHKAALLLLCVIATGVFAQTPEELPTIVRNALSMPGEYVIPAPAGWGASCVGLRNTPAQQLATIDYFNDSLKSFAQTGIPQITLYDAVFASEPKQGSSNALYVLAGYHGAFCLYRAEGARAIVKIAPLDPGEYGLSPELCSMQFIGAAGRDSTGAQVLIMVAQFHDAPLRHVIAAYTANGESQWQFALGGSAVHAFLVQMAPSSRSEKYSTRVFFSTDASPSESADTLSINANKSYAAAISEGGKLLWTTILGGAGTTSWCIVTHGSLVCAASREGNDELFELSIASGITTHFRRITENVIPRTLCAIGSDSEVFQIALAEMPSIITVYDSTLRETEHTVLASPLDSTSALVAIRNNDEQSFMLFTPQATRVYSAGFHLSGIATEGMEYTRSGVFRFSGTAVGNGVYYCAQTAAGGYIRALVPNPWWWWYRYRIIFAIVVFWLAIGVGAYAMIKKYRFYRTYYNQLVRSSATTGVIALNRQQRTLYMNNAARDLLHIAPYLPLNRHITEYLPQSVYSDLGDAIRDCLLMRRGSERIFTMQDGAQSKTFLNRVRPTISRGGALQGCIVQVEDITHTMERERLLNWASVAHHIAHEMKTPIGTVMLNAQHLQKSEEELPLNLRKYLLRITTQSERLSAILQTFLRIARFNAMNLIPMPIAPLVQRLAADYTEMLPASITIRTAIYEPDSRVALDAEQLMTALRNILDNAVNAIKPDEGAITLSVSSRTSAAGRFIVIAIRDSGKGMSESCRARVFEPFYTETPGGSGIGMMIVKRIIEEHHGSVEIDSEPGKGTEVRVLLPEEPAAE